MVVQYNKSQFLRCEKLQIVCMNYLKEYNFISLLYRGLVNFMI
jgi:hypothetical protein